MPSLFESMSRLGLIENPSPRVSSPTHPAKPETDHVYVSTKLDMLTRPATPECPEHIEHNGITYQRLTPPYFLWLNQKVNTVLHAYEQKRVPEAQWNLVRERFTAINIAAVRLFGPDAINKALENPPLNTPSPTPNRPISPPPFLYPAQGDFAFTQPVTKESVEKVQAILPDAISKGWVELQLLQNRGDFAFPCGQSYGLVCFMEGAKSIGSITESYIEIVENANTQRPVIMRFHNNRAPQAWLRRVETNP